MIPLVQLLKQRTDIVPLWLSRW